MNDDWGIGLPKTVKNKKRIEFQLDSVADADIIDFLNQKFNVGQYIRELIRKDIQESRTEQ